MTRINRPRTLTTAAFCLLILTVSSKAVAGESIRLSLRSGRVFSGRIHKQTNGVQLWLESGSRSVKIVRPIQWSRITAATIDGKPITVAQLQKQIKQLKAAQPKAGPRIIRLTNDGRTDAQRAHAALGFGVADAHDK